MNQIISIGYLGGKRCYLNVPKSQAIKRFIKSEDITKEEFISNYTSRIDFIQFDDEFEAYEIFDI